MVIPLEDYKKIHSRPRRRTGGFEEGFELTDEDEAILDRRRPTRIPSSRRSRSFRHCSEITRRASSSRTAASRTSPSSKPAPSARPELIRTSAALQRRPSTSNGQAPSTTHPSNSNSAAACKKATRTTANHPTSSSQRSIRNAWSPCFSRQPPKGGTPNKKKAAS